MHSVVKLVYPLLRTYTLLALYPFLLSAGVYRIIGITHLHALRVELKQLRKLQDNLTGDATPAGEAKITTELMATIQDEIQIVQKMGDSGIEASCDCGFVGSSLRMIAALFVGRLAILAGWPLCLLTALQAQA